MPRLFIDIAARFAQFQDALDKIGVSSARTARTLESSFANAGRTVRTLVSGFLVLQGIRWAKGIIDGADQLHTLHERTKIATEDLAGLQFAAEQSGTDVETLATAVQNLQKAISGAGTGTDRKAKQLFEALGLKEASQGAEDVLQTLLKIADILPSLDANAQTRIARDLMKVAGVDVLPALSQGRAALEAQIARGKELAPNIAENARRADEFKDKWNEASRAIQGAALPALIALTPVLSKMADEVSRASKSGNGLLAFIGGLLKLPYDIVGQVLFGPDQGAVQGHLSDLRRELQLLDTELNSWAGKFDRFISAPFNNDRTEERLRARRAAILIEIHQLEGRHLGNLSVG